MPMWDAACAAGGFVEIVFSAPDGGPGSGRESLGITHELQELRDIAGFLQVATADAAAESCDAGGAESAPASTPAAKRKHETSATEQTSIHVPAALLTSASPIFASTLERGWKEASERKITVQGFDRDDFCVFLDCLFALANETMLPKLDEVLDNPSLLRKVLPIAHYYQVDALKKIIFESVLRQDKPVIEAAKLVLAVESSLPEEEVPDWPISVIQGLNLYFKCSQQDHVGRLDDSRQKECVEDLSAKTLRKTLKAPFIDFVNDLQWVDLIRPAQTVYGMEWNKAITSTSAGPQYEVKVMSNSGKTVMGSRTENVPWKANLTSALLAAKIGAARKRTLANVCNVYTGM